jgi:hypothetical protein
MKAGQVGVLSINSSVGVAVLYLSNKLFEILFCHCVHLVEVIEGGYSQRNYRGFIASITYFINFIVFTPRAYGRCEPQVQSAIKFKR